MKPGGRDAPPQRVRIIGGAWRRLLLPVPDLPGLRPTPDRVRETLFNWLGQDLAGQRCLDLFAGTGALGFEAASRGAAEVTMFERDRRAAAALEASRDRLGADRVAIRCGDALTLAAALPDASFDLIFIDPPFALDLHAGALAAAARMLRPGGRVYLEAGKPVEAVAGADWEVLRTGRAGQSHHGLLRRKTDSENG